MSTSRHYDVVLLGKIGAGKSATGNTLLGRETFSFNHTTVVQVDEVYIDEVTFKVHDTPGLFDPERDNEDIMEKCQPLCRLSPSVPTVFLLVMKIHRFTPEDRRTVELIEDFVPEWLLHNIWILFTRGDELERENISIQECIEETEELKRVVQRFNYRYHVFNNIQTCSRDQVRSLIEKIKANLRTKLYTPLDRDIQLVRRPSDLDPYDDEVHVLRAVLSCGHVTGPQTLTDFCRVEIESGKFKLRCPECRTDWPYDEVRRLAKLTPEEQEFFEETLGENFMKKLVDFKTCPGCESFIERSNPSNLSVQCAVCCERTGGIYEFCWQCLKEWKGPHHRSDRCDNEGCTNEDLQLLMSCKTITLPDVRNIECPSVRACPTCGTLNEHNTQACKNIICSRCNIEFCFLCLKLTPECLQTSTHFILCSAGVAPRQTSIPSCSA